MFNKMRLGKRGAEKRFGITTAFLSFLRQGTPMTNGQRRDIRADLKRLSIILSNDLRFKIHVEKALRRLF